jgi:hypothetical protein
MVLLTSAGLLLHSLWKLETAPLGMQTDHVIVARFVLGRQHYGSDAQQLALFNDLERRLAAAPGVDAFAIADSLPPSGGVVAWRYVTPGYFATLAIPILRGRPFTPQDRDASAFVAILSETLARKLFPHENPIGKHILSGPQGQWTTVIGVARPPAGALPASSRVPPSVRGWLPVPSAPSSSSSTRPCPWISKPCTSTSPQSIDARASMRSCWALLPRWACRSLPWVCSA